MIHSSVVGDAFVRPLLPLTEVGHIERHGRQAPRDVVTGKHGVIPGLKSIGRNKTGEHVHVSVKCCQKGHGRIGILVCLWLLLTATIPCRLPTYRVFARSLRSHPTT